MKSRLAAVGIALCLTSCGSAQLESEVAGLFPTNAKYQQLRRSGDAICGQVNVPGDGGTDGYARFIGFGGSGTLDPGKAYAEPEVRQFEQTCDMVRAGGSAMDRTACNLADQARLTSKLKTKFEASWAKNCT